MDDIVQNENSAFVYRRSNGIPAYYKVGFSDHKYSFPCVGDVLFGWEAKESNDIPKITLKKTESYAPTVTLNNFGGKIWSVIDWSPYSIEHNVQSYSNSSKSAKVPLSGSANASFPYCAFIGVTFPSNNRYTDNTNRNYLSIFNGNTAHIQGVDDKVCPNGVLFQNAIMVKTNSTNVGFSYGAEYYRRTNGDMFINVVRLAKKTSSFTIDTSGSKFYIIRNAKEISATDIVKYGTDYTLDVGNGFAVYFSENTTIEILGCFMSMKRL